MYANDITVSELVVFSTSKTMYQYMARYIIGRLRVVSQYLVIAVGRTPWNVVS